MYKAHVIVHSSTHIQQLIVKAYRWTRHLCIKHNLWLDRNTTSEDGFIERRLYFWYIIYRYKKSGRFATFTYSPFHKTLPKCSLLVHWISVRFYEMGDTLNVIYLRGPKVALRASVVWYIQCLFTESKHCLYTTKTLCIFLIRINI